MIRDRRWWSWRAAAVPLAVAVAISIAVVALVLIRPWAGSGQQSDSQLRAAIVDQLTVGAPPPPFVEATTALLERSGYIVDYYPGEEVTVDFYRQLPTHGYDLILLRAHSGLIQGGDREGEAFIFTTESYNQMDYLDEQRAGRLLMATYSLGPDLSVELRDLPRFFGIVPDFVKSSMSGDFDGATVILMGCNGLTSESMAAAFVEKGARSVVSWDGLVTGDHTDEATERLLELMLGSELTMGDAVARTRNEVGPDPWYGSELLFYPEEEAVSTIP